MADLAAWLTVQLDGDERIARDRLCVNCGTPTTPLASHVGAFAYTHAGGWEGIRCPGSLTGAEPVQDPARFLRRIAADRELLADVLAEPHFRNEEDNWYSCAALTDEDGEPVCLDETRAPGPCDCGRDARVARRLRLLALPFEDQPGYAEAVASAE